MSRFGDELTHAVAPWLDLAPVAANAMENHYELLLKWNRTVNLTRITELKEAVDRHYAECFYLGVASPVRFGSIADIGSGAGFPGIPIAALWPDCSVTLVESDTRKAAFLRECRDLLPNLRVECVRAEHLSGDFGAVVGRAVRPADVVRVGRRCSQMVGLLISPEDIKSVKLVEMQVSVVPGGGKGTAVWGTVPRET